jgi:hypothetical protein
MAARNLSDAQSELGIRVMHSVSLPFTGTPSFWFAWQSKWQNKRGFSLCKRFCVSHLLLAAAGETLTFYNPYPSLYSRDTPFAALSKGVQRNQKSAQTIFRRFGRFCMPRKSVILKANRECRRVGRYIAANAACVGGISQ